MHAEEDKKNKEAVEIRNNADQLVYQTEQALAEIGDKIKAEQPHQQPPYTAISDNKTHHYRRLRQLIRQRVKRLAKVGYHVEMACYPAVKCICYSRNDNYTCRHQIAVCVRMLKALAADDAILPQEHYNKHGNKRYAHKRQYIRQLCYVFKFGIVTNGLGVIRHISFYNKDFMDSHPQIVVDKKSDSPDEDKSAHDSKLLIPTLKDFFKKHPLINPKTFLGDAAFDTLQLYKDLLTGDTFGNNRHFSKAYIPLNARSSLKNADYTINENGIPCCPLDESLSMKYEGISKLKSGFTRYKFVCPKIKWVYDSATKKYHRECLCDTPCTPSKSGRMVYIYPEKDLRAYPGTIRGTDEWDNTYKIRTVVEREINHIKENLCLAGRRTQNEKTLHADLILAGITQLITVVLADKIHHPEYVRSLKPLIA